MATQVREKQGRQQGTIRLGVRWGRVKPRETNEKAGRGRLQTEGRMKTQRGEELAKPRVVNFEMATAGKRGRLGQKWKDGGSDRWKG